MGKSVLLLYVFQWSFCAEKILVNFEDHIFSHKLYHESTLTSRKFSCNLFWFIPKRWSFEWACFWPFWSTWKDILFPLIRILLQMFNQICFVLKWCNIISALQIQTFRYQNPPNRLDKVSLVLHYIHIHYALLDRKGPKRHM